MKTVPTERIVGTRKGERAVKLQKEGEATSLRGTLAAVLILGGLVVASWLGVFYLFMSRS